MPGTPTFSKAVHFNEDIEQVRHFLQVDKPSAVSAGSSPVETYDSESEYPFSVGKAEAKAPEWELRLSNFPRETFERKVRSALQQMETSDYAQVRSSAIATHDRERDAVFALRMVDKPLSDIEAVLISSWVGVFGR